MYDTTLRFHDVEPQATYRMALTDGTRWLLTEMGDVLWSGRMGFRPDGKWCIFGAATRHNAHAVMGLAEIAEHGVPGQGWVHDFDHGTHRVWGNGRRMQSLRRIRR